MQTFDVAISDDGSIILPDEAIALLNAKKRRSVTLFLEGGVVHILPATLSIEEARGAIPSAEHSHSRDWDAEIEDAIDEALREKYG
jgi:hypothetical protein